MPMGRLHRPLATWIGDSDLVPHLLSILREGAIDVEVRFGAPVEFNAQSSRKAVTQQMEGIVARWSRRRCTIRAGRPGQRETAVFCRRKGLEARA